MEEIHAPDLGEFKPNDPVKDIMARKNAEAFLAMADDISQNPQAQAKPEQPRERVMNPATPKERVNASIPMGPKYLEALDSVIGMADIRAIETELPILKTKVEVTPLTGKEEQALRTAAVSPESFLKKIDELLFNHTKFNNYEFTSYHDFLANLFPPDKSILIWALMSSSYIVLPTVEKECGSCGERYMLDASPNDLIQQDTIKKIWDKDLPPTQFTVAQDVLDGYITFELAMPSERDRLIVTQLVNPEQAKDNVNETGGLLSYTDNLVFFTKVLSIGEKDSRIVLTDVVQDVYPFLNNLPPKISDAVKNQIDLTIFDEYMPRFYLKTNCKHCRVEEEIDVDPEIAFFRKAISL